MRRIIGGREYQSHFRVLGTLPNFTYCNFLQRLSAVNVSQSLGNITITALFYDETYDALDPDSEEEEDPSHWKQSKITIELCGVSHCEYIGAFGTHPVHGIVLDPIFKSPPADVLIITPHQFYIACRQVRVVSCEKDISFPISGNKTLTDEMQSNIVTLYDVLSRAEGSNIISDCWGLFPSFIFCDILHLKSVSASQSPGNMILTAIFADLSVEPSNDPVSKIIIEFCEVSHYEYVGWTRSWLGYDSVRDSVFNSPPAGVLVIGIENEFYIACRQVRILSCEKVEKE